METEPEVEPEIIESDPPIKMKAPRTEAQLEALAKGRAKARELRQQKKKVL